jgi:hypothetical protein
MQPRPCSLHRKSCVCCRAPVDVGDRATLSSVRAIEALQPAPMASRLGMRSSDSKAEWHHQLCTRKEKAPSHIQLAQRLAGRPPPNPRAPLEQNRPRVSAPPQRQREWGRGPIRAGDADGRRRPNGRRLRGWGRGSGAKSSPAAARVGDRRGGGVRSEGRRPILRTHNSPISNGGNFFWVG